MSRILSGGAWRIAPCGTSEVYVIRTTPTRAIVCSRVGSAWAKRSMTIARADLFGSREEARAEYRRRRDAALSENPTASLNLTTEI